MRLTADVLLSAPVAFNPLNQREVQLRGLKATAIENLAVTQDAFESMDLSGNEITRLENFPPLRRLRTLLLSNNLISRVEASLGSSLPSLDALVLSGNRIASLGDIQRLASLSNLTLLSLLNNPVTRKAHYRFYTIFAFPRLRVLDFQKVKRRERIAAFKFFNSKAGAAIAAEIERLARDPAGVDAAPAAAAAASSTAAGAAVEGGSSSATAFTADQVAMIRAAIAAAGTTAEIDRLEGFLRAGKLPPEFQQSAIAAAVAEAPVPLT